MISRSSRLGRLLRPRHIAAFGGGWAENVVEQCNLMGFDGEVWPVHPEKSQVQGRKCYRGVDDLPCPPDASFIGVSRSLTPALLERLSARGAGGAICFASGFAEAGLEDARGADMQADLVKAANGMPFLGPNCYGMINFVDGAPVWPDQHGGKRCDSGVAILTQSSNIAINISMQARGLPVAYLITVGNQASVRQADIARELLADSRVTAIGLHIESFSGASDYEALADAARNSGKPVVAIKAGSSAEAKEAAVSHTGAMAGSDTYASALFRRLGFARVRSIQVLIEALKILHVGGPLGGRKICSLSCSGGEACLMADAAASAGLRFPALEPGHAHALRAALGPMVHLANPLDYHTYQWGDETALTRIFSAMLSGGYDFAFLVIDFPRTDRCSDAEWEPAANAIASSSAATGVRAAVVSCLPENLPESWSERFIGKGIAPLHGIDDALAAADAAAAIGEHWNRPRHSKLTLTGGNGRIRTLNEAEAKAELGGRGVPVPAGTVADNDAEVFDASDAIGYPVVIKSLGFEHKTEAGAVAANLADRASVAEALKRMPKAGGYLVERHVAGAVAELLIGATSEGKGQGLMLTLGAGGVMAELMADTRSILLPASREDIEEALRSLRIWKLLDGYRGGRPADVGALVDAVGCLAAYAAERADTLAEVEINPYLALPEGGCAADALIREHENE